MSSWARRRRRSSRSSYALSSSMQRQRRRLCNSSFAQRDFSRGWLYRTHLHFTMKVVKVSRTHIHTRTHVRTRRRRIFRCVNQMRCAERMGCAKTIARARARQWNWTRSCLIRVCFHDARADGAWFCPFHCVLRGETNALPRLYRLFVKGRVFIKFNSLLLSEEQSGKRAEP